MFAGSSRGDAGRCTTLRALIVGCLLEACKPLADCVETIPVPAVILLLSVYIILSAWVPDFAF